MLCCWQSSSSSFFTAFTYNSCPLCSLQAAQQVLKQSKCVRKSFTAPGLVPELKWVELSTNVFGSKQKSLRAWERKKERERQQERELSTRVNIEERCQQCGTVTKWHTSLGLSVPPLWLLLIYSIHWHTYKLTLFSFFFSSLKLFICPLCSVCLFITHLLSLLECE